VLVGREGTPVTATRELLVKAAATADGKWIEQGAALARLDPAEDEARLKRVEGELAQLQKQLSELKRSVPSKKVAKAEALVRKREGELAAARATAQKLEAKGASEAKKAAAKKKADLREQQLADAKRVAAELGKAPAIAALQEQVQQAVAARDRTKTELSEAQISAPMSGIVSDLKAEAGKRIAAGQLVAKIIDPEELVAVTSVEPGEARALEVGQVLTATVKGQPVRLTIQSVDGPRATAKLPNAQRVFAPGDTGEAVFNPGARSVLGRLFD
jgi:multidrug resistance efflux pump